MSRNLANLLVPTALLVSSLNNSPVALAQAATRDVTPPVATMMAPRDESIIDYYFGTAVADPYRWLEHSDAPATRSFIEAQNVRTQAYLGTPLRDELRARLEQLINYPRTSTPGRTDNYFVFRRNTGLQKQSVTFMARTLDAEPTVLFDPNTFSEDGTIALSSTAFTRDGSLVAWGKSVGGSDDQTIRIRNVSTGAELPEVFENMRFAGLAWKNDNSGFFFSRFPKPGSVAPDQERLNHKLYFHKVGDDVAKAALIYQRPDNPEMSVYPDVSFDGKWLAIYESIGTDDRAGILVAPVDQPGEWKRVLEVSKSRTSIVDTEGDTLFALTDDNAPRKRLVAIDLNDPAAEKWKTIIPHSGDVIESVSAIGGKFVVTLKRDVQTVINIHARDGTLEREVELPTVGNASVSGRPDDSEMFVSFTSYTYPTTVFRYDLKTNEMKVWFAPKVEFDPTAYETKQVFYGSKDGTRVPMFVTYKKGMKLDRNNPTLLYGYGGFGVGLSPGFSAFNVAWLERGGVFAEACLRGGDEYGSGWHDAGKLDKKQNVFDDFHAAAEHLIRDGYTSSGKLVINGGSNGGLLVAACVLQRPELYGAVVAEVGVLDMLRFHRFGTGRFWTVEYGNAEASRPMFETLFAYSPLHNVKPKQPLPPILVTTGDGDDRVVPAHSLKFVAELNFKNDKNPVFLRYDVGSGHGGGKPLSKAIDEQADVFAFMFKSLGADQASTRPTQPAGAKE